MAGGGLVTKSCPSLGTPWPVVHQAPLSMGFPRQEHWSGLPFPPPGESSQPRNRTFADGLLTTEPPGGWGMPYYTQG